MNKLIIGLLIVAAGSGAFFYFNQRNSDKPQQDLLTKEWIIGKWKTVSYQPVTDSVQPMFQYDFQKEGLVLRSINDSAKADSSHYEWSKTNELVFKENVVDSIAQTFTVLKLTQDSLQVKSQNNFEIHFTRLK